MPEIDRAWSLEGIQRFATPIATRLCVVGFEQYAHRLTECEAVSVGVLTNRSTMVHAAREAREEGAMGVLFKSVPVKAAAKPRLLTAYGTDKAEEEAAAGAAEAAAGEVETAARATKFDWRIFFGLLALVAFVVVAGMVSEYVGIAKWDERLVALWGWLVPFLVGYVGGEFVSEKTK